MNEAIILAYSLFFETCFNAARKRFVPHMAEDVVNSAISVVTIDLLENPIESSDPEEVALIIADRWLSRTRLLRKEDQNREDRKPQWWGTDDQAGAQFQKMGWSCPNPEEALLRKEWKVRLEIAKRGLSEDDLAFLEATRVALEARLASLDARFGRSVGTRNQVQRLNGDVGRILNHPQAGEPGYAKFKQRRAAQQAKVAAQLAHLRD